LLRDEAEHVAVDGFEINTVLVAVIKATASDLRELAGSVETFRDERVGWRSVDFPVRACRAVAIRVERLSAEEQALVW